MYFDSGTVLKTYFTFKVAKSSNKRDIKSGQCPTDLSHSQLPQYKMTTGQCKRRHQDQSWRLMHGQSRRRHQQNGDHVGGERLPRARQGHCWVLAPHIWYLTQTTLPYPYVPCEIVKWWRTLLNSKNYWRLFIILRQIKPSLMYFLWK